MTGRIPDHRHEGSRCPFCTEVGKLLKSQDISPELYLTMEVLLDFAFQHEADAVQAFVDAGVPRAAVPGLFDKLLRRGYTAARLGPLTAAGKAMAERIREAASRPPTGPPGGR